MHNVMQTLDSKNYMDHNMEYDSVICTRKYPVEIKTHYLFLDRYWRLVIQMTILNFVEILDFKFFSSSIQNGKSFPRKMSLTWLCM